MTDTSIKNITIRKHYEGPASCNHNGLATEEYSVVVTIECKVTTKEEYEGLLGIIGATLDKARHL